MRCAELVEGQLVTENLGAFPPFRTVTIEAFVELAAALDMTAQDIFIGMHPVLWIMQLIGIEEGDRNAVFEGELHLIGELVDHAAPELARDESAIGHCEP